MISSFIKLYPKAKITHIQSTFIELATDVELHRVDFIGKVEAKLKRGKEENLSYHTSHRLLTLYHEPVATVFLNSQNGNANELIAAIENLISRLVGGWQSQWLKFQSIEPRKEMIRVVERGRGHLLNCVPKILAEQIHALCWLHDADTSLRILPYLPNPNSRKTPPFTVLFIGDNYVIANDFYVSTLVGSAFY